MPYQSLFKRGNKRGENEQPSPPPPGGYPYQPHQHGSYTQLPPASRQTLSAPPLPPRQPSPVGFAPSPDFSSLQRPQSLSPPHTSLSPPTALSQAPSLHGYPALPVSLSGSTIASNRTPSPSGDPARQPLTPQPSAVPSPSHRPTIKRDPPKLRKILSLDGGGVRGLSIIRILKYVMQELNRERGLESAPLDPWQEFDMIGGTSTGGIIAIMLGRLHMTLDECESAYSMLSETIFTPIHNSANPINIYKFLNAQGKFSSTPLEDCIKSTIWSKNLPEHALLKNLDADSCRVFVCATRAEDHSLAVLRSYKTRRHDPLFDICKIWEAVRATSAASTFFEPIEIGPSRQKFVDGALTGKNNPIRTAYTESRDIWPSEDRLILSIGTGAAPGQAVTGNLISLATRLKEIVVDSEQTNREFRMDHTDMIKNGRLYRFNVLQGLSDVGLEEHQAINRIATYTDRYLDDPDIFDMVQACVGNLHLGGQRLGIMPEEELDGMFEAMTVHDALVVCCVDCLQGFQMNTTTYYCIECDAQFCSNCQSSHARMHAIHLVRCSTQVWSQSAMTTFAAVASCSECSLEVRCRTECSVCLRAICDDCYGFRDRRLGWLEHRLQHGKGNGIIAIVSPTYLIVPPLDHRCDCLQAKSCVSHCGACFKAIKIGDTIYRCRTCKNEYHSVQELCEDCNNRHLRKHVDHNVSLLLTRRVTDMPDDRSTQLESWWRCAYPGCGYVTGPDVDWQHRHPEGVLCIGDAVADVHRKFVPQGCVKTALARMRLKDPPNATDMKCDICDKAIAYDVWHLWCTTCDSFTCKTCIDTGRAGHRHAMNWTRVVKSPLNAQFVFGNYKICDRCSQQYFAHLFEGFECAICREYHCCLTCVKKNVRPDHPVCGGKAATFDFKLLRA